MQEESSFTNALAEAAQSLASQIGQCQAVAERCLGLAMERRPHDAAPEAGSAFLSQAESLMRVSVELAGALAKLKGDGNVHRQHISVERIGSPSTPSVPARREPTPSAQKDSAQTNSAQTDAVAPKEPPLFEIRDAGEPPPDWWLAAQRSARGEGGVGNPENN